VGIEKMTDIQTVRDNIHQIKLKTFGDLDDDMGNLDVIMAEYKLIHKATVCLVDLENQNVQEALMTHPFEFQFFSACTSNLRTFMEYFDHLISKNRSIKYAEIRHHDSRDMNHAAINQLIDSNEEISNMTVLRLRVKEVYDRFVSRLDAYKQRGYTLNNLMKAFETESGGIVLD